MVSTGVIGIIGIAIYLLVLVIMIYKHPLPEKTIEEFAVAGRSFGWILISFTIIGTWYTGSCYMAFPGMAWTNGIIGSYLVFYTLLGLVLLYGVAGGIWKWGKTFNLRTQPDVIFVRFRSKPLKILVSIVGVVVEYPWLFTEYLASAFVLYWVSDGIIPIKVGVWIFAIFIVGYCLYSGMRSVVWSDLVQGMIFVIGGTALFIYLAYHFFDGFGPLFDRLLSEIPEHLSVPGAGWGEDVPGPWFWPSLIIAGGVGAYAWPSCFGRIYAAKSSKDLKKMVFITPLIAAVFMMLVIWLSLGGGFIPEVVAADNPEHVLLIMSKVGLGIGGIVLVGIIVIAAAMSMEDSCIHIWSVQVADDIVEEIKPDITSEGLLKASRAMVVVIGLSAAVVCMLELPTLLQMIMRMYQGIIQIFPLIFIGIYWRRATKAGAYAGFIGGLIVTGVLSWYYPDWIPQLGGVQAGIVGLIVNVALMVGVSLLTKPDPYVQDLFDIVEGKEVSTTEKKRILSEYKEAAKTKIKG
ncbi:MAG TPA: sodium:solute symporter family protein [Thermoplasmatales archaeon]|nr:sodium:solute symporter family protein [Thermoplasmatales archaeon]